MAVETEGAASPATGRAPPPALRLDGVSVRVGGRLALSDVSFEVAPGTFVGLIGPNGSGKSTLLRAALGILPLAAGSIEVEGRAPDEARDAFAYVPQRRQAVAWALERVGLAERRNTPIGELSFGQQQRVFFARALAQEGRILLLDEPMNGVDTQTQDVFLDLLDGFRAAGKTIV